MAGEASRGAARIGLVRYRRHGAVGLGWASQARLGVARFGNARNRSGFFRVLSKYV